MAGQLQNNYSTAKIFIGDNRWIKGDYTNSTGDSITIPAGRLFGRIASTNAVALHVAASTNGSQVPRFVLGEEVTVANGATVELTLCYAGDVAEGQLVLNSGNTMATTVSLVDSATNTVVIGTIGDLLRANGINPITTDDYTAYDNA